MNPLAEDAGCSLSVAVRNSRLSEDIRTARASIVSLPCPVAQPALVVVSGLPGSGKSYLSRRLAERLPSVLLQSDTVRKLLVARPGYTAAENARVFSALHMMAEQFLRDGFNVIMDATNLTEMSRRHFYRIADRTGARLVLVETRAPVRVIRERLNRRAQGSDVVDPSDAGWDVYLRMKVQAEPIRRRHLVVDTSGDIGPALDRILRAAMGGRVNE